MHTLTLPNSPNPAPQTFHDLRATDLLIRRSSDGSHTATLQLQPHAPRPVPIAGQPALIHDPAGNLVFQGTLLHVQTTAQSRDSSHAWEFTGPNWHLNRYTFLQPDWNFPDDLDDPNSPLSPHTSSRVILNSTSTGTKNSLRQQINEILHSATSQGANFTWDSSALPNLNVPEEERQNLTVLQALHHSLRWLPHCHLRWDLSRPVPHLQFIVSHQNTAAAARPFPALQHITSLRATQLAAFPLPQLRIQSYLPTTRSYSSTDSNGNPTTLTRNWLQPQLSTSTAPGDPIPGSGSHTLSYFLRGPVTQWQLDEPTGNWTQTELIPAEEPLSPNLAQHLHSGFTQPAIALEATIEPPDPHLDLAPGDSLQTTHLTTLDPALQGIPLPPAITITEVEISLATNRITLKAGPPPRPPFWDLEPLLNLDNDFIPPISTSQRATGRTSKLSSSFGEDSTPDPLVKIYGCENGQPVYYRFRPHIIQGPYPA